MKCYPIGNTRKTSHKQGGILVIAIIVILAMLIMAIPFLFKLSGQWRTTEKSSHSLAAFNLAEAGVERTLYYLDPYSPVLNDAECIVWTHVGTNLVGTINEVKSPNNNVIGHVNVLLADPIGVPPAPQKRTLTSTGLVPFIAGNTVNRTVQVLLEQYYKSIFEIGFFVDERFDIGTAFKMGSYNSNEDPPPDSPADAESNAIFGMNSYYYGDEKPSWFGNANILINGEMVAGGDAAEAYNEGTGPLPDKNVLEGKNGVIDVPNPAEVDTSLMTQRYDLNSVDVFDLPPKDMLGDMPSVASWFENPNPSDPKSATYYPYRIDSVSGPSRAPYSSEIKDGFEKGNYMLPEGTSDTLTEANSGIYTSFILGEDLSSVKNTAKGDCSLYIQGDVVIFVTALSDASNTTGRFTMGSNSSINLIPQADGTPSKLTLILGNTSFIACDGYNLNAQPQPPYDTPHPADFRILGTDQFLFPDDKYAFDTTPKQLKDLDDICGLMHFEQGKSNGNIYAAIYAPRANFGGTGQGENHMNLYGACITEYMSFKNQVDFFYDEALADLNIITGGYDFWRIVSWQELIGY